MDWDALRKNYPITTQGAFLNHAATSPVSLGTIQRVQELGGMMAEPLSKHFYSWLGIIERLRRKIAELLNVHPSEIAFTQNTSTALSLIANAVAFAPGDRVLVPSNEYPSNLYAWQNLAYKGVECTLFDPVANEPLVQTLQKLDLHRVKLISISAVSFKTGRCYELKEFAQFCRERNILSCLDAIQAIGSIPLDIADIGVDFLASGAQKWLLGPIGCGFFFARRELLPTLHVPFVGWGSVKYPEKFIPKLDLADEMTRFEPGLPNILPVAGLERSMTELQAIGFSAIYARLKSHIDYLRHAIVGMDLPLLTGPRDLPSSLLSFRLPAHIDKIAFAERLAQKNITVTIREDYLRLSPHFYTKQSEMDAFLNVMEDSLGRKGSAIQPKEQIKQAVPAQTGSGWIILTGATGILGTQIAPLLVQRGHNVLLLGRSQAKLDALKAALTSLAVEKQQLETYVCDFTKASSVEVFLTFLKEKGVGYSHLIHCAGMALAEPFANLRERETRDLFQVNLFVPARITQAFFTTHKTTETRGVLLIVPASARCGIPLVSAFGGSFGAWWTMAEALDREIRNEGHWVTTYVAPAMHSNLQKQLGRVALRYFKLSGTFDYAHAPHVAKEALEAFFNKKSTVVSTVNRWSLFLNLWWPSLVSRRISKIWRP